MSKATEDPGRLDSPLSDQLGLVPERTRSNTGLGVLVG